MANLSVKDYATLTNKNQDLVQIDGVVYKQIDNSTNTSSGYQGYAYQNTSTGEIIVVHEGSEPLFSGNNNEFTKTGWILMVNIYLEKFLINFMMQINF